MSVPKCWRVFKLPPEKRRDKDFGVCIGVLQEARPDSHQDDTVIVCFGDWDNLCKEAGCGDRHIMVMTPYEAEYMAVSLIRAASVANIRKGKLGDLAVPARREEGKT